MCTLFFKNKPGFSIIIIITGKLNFTCHIFPNASSFSSKSTFCQESPHIKVKTGHLVTETYQNNSSCGSNKGIQKPTLQRQPTAAGKAEEKTFNSHHGINIQVNGAHQHTIVLSSIIKGEVPYAVTPYPKFHRVIEC